jgi:SAM-dependent methyltransferase
MQLIKKIIKKITPQRCLIFIVYVGVIVRYLFAVILYFGFRFKCPCCGGNFRRFLPQPGLQSRLNAVCPACGCLERHRLLWLYLKNKTNFFRDNLNVLDIAPVPFLQLKFKFFRNLNYTSADISSSVAMLKIDVTNIPLEDNQFDSIICYHVLEHISDDRKAMKELFRVLKSGGWAIVQSPIDINRKKTFEDPSVMTPEEREHIFKKKDHVRIYGRDYKERLEAAGFKVRVEDYVKELDRRLVKKYSLMEDEKIYFCTKPE